MFFLKKLYYIYKIHKDKKQGIKLASYPVVCNDLSISDCCLAIKTFCKYQKIKVPDAPAYYYFDGDDKENLGEKNYPNYLYFRLGFLLVAELGIVDYNNWKNEFDARVKEFILPCLNDISLYDNLCQSVWYHKYQLINVCDRYKVYPELYKYIDERGSIYRLAEYSRKLNISLFTLHDIYPNVNNIKIYCRYYVCKNTNVKYKVDQLVISLIKDSEYRTKLPICNNPIHYICSGTHEYDFRNDIANAIKYHNFSCLAKNKSCEGENIDKSKCYSYTVFEIKIEYDD